MTRLLERQPLPCAPGQGVLRAEHFQCAYVTTDITRACALFTQRLGIREWASLGGPFPAGGRIEARFAWVDTVMYELIEADGPGSDIYRGPLDRAIPRDGFAMALHHLGYLLHHGAQWDALLAEAERQGWAIPSRSHNPLMRACFIDVPEFGHYLEYLLPEPAGLEFFASVPRH